MMEVIYDEVVMKNNGKLWSMQTMDVFLLCVINGPGINEKQVHDILV
jgi:hypothetical protein